MASTFRIELTTANAGQGRAGQDAPPADPLADKRKAREAESFDPVAEARKMLERQQQQQAARQAYDRLPEVVAKRADEADKARAEQAASAQKALLGKVAGQAGVNGQTLQAAGTVGTALTEGAGAVAGGPAGVVLAAVNLAEQAGKKLGEVVATIGDQFTKVATLDVGGLADNFADAAKQIPLFGEAIANAEKAVLGFVRGLDQTAARLAPYSAALSAAEGQAKAREVQGELGRANLLGSELARFVDARSRLQTAGEDALALALKPLIPLVTRATEIVASTLETIVSLIKQIPGLGDSTEEQNKTLSALLGTEGFGLLDDFEERKGFVGGRNNGISAFGVF